ncbi:enoyl-CoA hydratase/isomerase family protein [Streptomyces purpurogeneiscleroticus]|uniref:enoyl-CoA hydratase/isomerase family protein n=1 Tax=Streptomyces purpurogeneiscleroticus TaxID=68259 RepID=UPI001CBEDCDB|nr:enoyl-CoA hydratase-related protein [Streptomyces purpurogeneiscleroticus]MBZ4017644.1 hypothetical protein [Streptomyces purpurogeneiscleroticus]
MTTPPVDVAVRDAVAVVSIDRPPLNLLSTVVKATLTTTFEDLSSRADIRVIVLRGAGEAAFSAGADLREFPERIRQGNADEVSRAGHRLGRAIRGCPQPVVAALDGVVFGGGLELALYADLRIATGRARFAFPEITRGVFPGNGGSQLVSRLIGIAKAKELMLGGTPIDAAEAARIGMINRIVDPSALMAEALSWAGELAQRPRSASACIKRLVDEGMQLSFAQACELEATLFGEVFQSNDAGEGVDAFFAKRPPVFPSIPHEESP